MIQAIFRYVSIDRSKKYFILLLLLLKKKFIEQFLIWNPIWHNSLKNEATLYIKDAIGENLHTFRIGTERAKKRLPT